MFSIAPMPVFSETPWGPYQPAASSPLSISSSPIRGPSPLSPANGNSAPHRTAFSSPPGPPSKFASRPAKPNPLVRKREEGQETRRQLFLKKVRGRADDKVWERRSIEGHAVRRWYEEQREVSRLKELDTTAFQPEAEIEDAAAMAVANYQNQDTMMVDDVARQEELELEALIANMEQEAQSASSAAEAQTHSAQHPPLSYPPSSFHFSDDDEYEEIFMQLAQNESHDVGDEMDTC